MDAQGKIVRETKVASEPGKVRGWLFFGSLGFAVKRIGLEAGLVVGMAACRARLLPEVPSPGRWMR